MIRIHKWKKFIFQRDIQRLGIKSCILAVIYLFIAGYLISAASAGKGEYGTFTGFYKIGIYNSILSSKLDILGCAVVFAGGSEITLTDIGNIQNKRRLSKSFVSRGFWHQNLRWGKNWWLITGRRVIRKGTALAQKKKQA